MTEEAKRKGLGRGLSSLLGEDLAQEEAGRSDSDVRTVPVEFIVPNPEQPRRDFDADEMEALAASIREKGIIQPLIVRRLPDDPSSYQIVAGERRWRAAQMAQLHAVPVVVRDLTDAEVLELAIIENIQRADLNAVEEAGGFQRLIDQFGYTQEGLARIMGKSRSHIANTLRLLSLPEGVQTMLREGRLSAGHARTLVGRADAEDLAAAIVEKGLSVREAEQLVKSDRASGRGPSGGKGAKGRTGKNPDTVALENDLTAALGLKVTILHKDNEEQGEIRFGYHSLDQLDEICRRLCEPPSLRDWS
ncbi:ParB/RepB/Spo0J family partition protein [Futiania mangrovi]|uniref:ParB/RepB/Spo0J family partition protein n=1 Tax=Futiania mangrovi TaxID=2959716 RepID=A0A9J6PDQ6_9PROT|nr:ParB/RepB/Spo0J family partition protein [Futiania mangrovii]MCP1336510.1 ParB/RepB/Spo0J family partition protein [Futiania mangrovii]